MEELLKQRIKIEISIFQYGMTSFLAASTTLVGYYTKVDDFDFIGGGLIAVAFLSLLAAIPAIIEADKNATRLYK